MKLSLEGIKDKGKWEAAGITLPGYDIEMAAKKRRRPPDGHTLALEISSAFSSAVLQTDCWKRENWTQLSPV